MADKEDKEDPKVKLNKDGVPAGGHLSHDQLLALRAKQNAAAKK